MFGQSPLHRFLLLRRIFGASPVKECAEFILFLPAACAAQREKVKSVVLTFSEQFKYSHFFFRADERNFRDLRNNGHAALPLTAKILCGAPFQGHAADKKLTTRRLWAKEDPAAFRG